LATGNSKARHYLKQSISLAIQRGNGASQGVGCQHFGELTKFSNFGRKFSFIVFVLFKLIM
jgi:hypothetical protein